MDNLNQEQPTSNWGYLLPISLIMFLVPLIVYMKVVELSPIEIAHWTGGAESPDFFSYNKMIILNVLTIIGIILAYFYIKKEDTTLRKTKLYIPMAIYALFIIFSTITAEHTSVALWGFVDRYEGMFSLLSYLSIMFITMIMIDDEKSIKAIIYPLIASATIIGIIGIFQYIGYDFFQTTFGKRLILPMQYRDMAEGLKFNFGKNTIYSTLYNTNYVGSYMAILAPILLTLTILIKDTKKKLILVALTLIMFLNLVGSNSRGGMFGTGLAMVALIIMMRKQILKSWKTVIIGLAVLSIGAVGVNKISDGRLTNQITRLKSDLQSLVSSGEKEQDSNEYKIKEVSADNNKLKIQTTREALVLTASDGQVIFADGEDKAIDIQYDSETGKITLLDERYEMYNLSMLSDGENSRIELNLGGYVGEFVMVDDEWKYYRGLGVTKEIKEIPHIGFEGKESLGSGRGYIWSRTLPMLKKNIIVGNGPDTYAINFPQEDFKGRFNTKSMPYGIIVDKPHNMYMQIVTNTGGVSLLAFLSIVAMYLMQSVKTYFKRELDSDIEALGLGIFIAVIAYMLAGVFNDSVVSVAPVFWVVMGLGVAVNWKVLKNE